MTETSGLTPEQLAVKEARVCMKCGRTEPGWRYNRCPNCGEMGTGPMEDWTFDKLYAEVMSLHTSLSEKEVELEQLRKNYLWLDEQSKRMQTERDEALKTIKELQKSRDAWKADAQEAECGL